MTSVEKVLVVEGGTDLSIYDRVLSMAFPTKEGLVIPASFFKDTSNGKKGVLSVFHANKNRMPRKRAVFIVDKDIDDFSGRLIQHHSLLYTSLYNIENELICATPTSAALAVACGVTTQTAESWLGPARSALDYCSSQYFTWAALCILANCSGSHLTVKSFGVKRPIFKNVATSNLFRNRHSKGYCMRLRRDLNIKREDFCAHVQAKRTIVEALFASKAFDKVFNGKWYFPILEDTLESMNVVSKEALKGFGSRMRAALVALHPADSTLVLNVRAKLS